MADLVRVSILGSLPGGEKWSVNPIYRFSTGLALSSDELTAMATGINGVSVPGTILALNPAGVGITGTRVEARKVTGELENVAEVAKGTPTLGTSAVNHPLQTSIVLSLRSTDSTARGKGRLYWPAIGTLLNGSTMRFDSAKPTDFVNGMVTYLGAIRTAIRAVGGATTASLAVWSRTASDTKVVVQLRAGDVPDVQRRRRDKLVESYVSAPVP